MHSLRRLIAPSLAAAMIVQCSTPRDAHPQRAPRAPQPNVPVIHYDPTEPAAPHPAPVAAPLPEPPAQHRAWSPPAPGTLPAPWLDAVGALFDQGLGDPRDCAYREVTLLAGDLTTGRAEPVRTHAWVLPASPDAGAAPRYAVAWNGLVYPAQQLGADADLGADVRALVAASARRPRAPLTEYRPEGFATPERDAVGLAAPHPLRVALLARLGRDAMARDLLAPWALAPSQPVAGAPSGTRDPYLLLASALADQLELRAVAAHARADDDVALASARQLVALMPRVETEAARRRLPHPYPPNTTYLARSELPAELLRDQERRARRGLRPASPPAPQDTAARVVSEIRALDEAGAGEAAQSGDAMSFTAIPRVATVAREGRVAVEPLIECLERDERLSRVTWVLHMAMPERRGVVSVRELAYASLGAILATSNFGPWSQRADWAHDGLDAGWRRRAAEVRAFLGRAGTSDPAARFYNTLADDHATHEAWAEAASQIVVRTWPGAPPGMGSVPSTFAPPGQRGETFVGEALRAGRAPSVTELLTRRIDALAAAPDSDSARVACRLAIALSNWDPRGALAALARHAARVQARLPTASDDDRTLLATCLTTLTLARAYAGDAAALSSWGQWIATVRPDDLGDAVAYVLEPLWRERQSPAMQAAATALFGRDDSPWLPFARNGRDSRAELLSNTPLLELPVFNAAVVRALGDTTEIGDVLVAPGGAIGIHAGAYNATIGAGARRDPSMPPDGTAAPLRRCDAYAWFATGEGRDAAQSLYQLYWPRPRRDAALPAVIARVRARSGARP